MNYNQQISYLKKILEQQNPDGSVDADAIHKIFSSLKGKERLELADAAFKEYLGDNKQPYKAIFGIAISYARDSKDLSQSEWKNLSYNMKSSVEEHNKNTPDMLAWDHLPAGVASMKTMVFSILNREVSDIVKNLRRALAPIKSGHPDMGGSQERHMG